MIVAPVLGNAQSPAHSDHGDLRYKCRKCTTGWTMSTTNSRRKRKSRNAPCTNSSDGGKQSPGTLRYANAANIALVARADAQDQTLENVRITAIAQQNKAEHCIADLRAQYAAQAAHESQLAANHRYFAGSLIKLERELQSVSDASCEGVEHMKIMARSSQPLYKRHIRLQLPRRTACGIRCRIQQIVRDFEMCIDAMAKERNSVTEMLRAKTGQQDQQINQLESSIQLFENQFSLKLQT